MILSSKEVRDIITDHAVFDGVAPLLTADAYWLPSREWFVKDFAPAVSVEWFRYPSMPNRRDCNQAVRIALALAGNAMAKRDENATISIGRTIGGLYSTINSIDPNPVGTQHDTCLVILNDRILYFYEPQTSLLTPASEVSLGDWAAGYVEL
jgi:hypothetical protein